MSSRAEAARIGAKGGRLYLLFNLGEDRYAIAASQVREVLALRRIKAIPEEPAWLSGLIEHRGSVVPVIDLVLRATGRPAARRMATRIVLIDSGHEGRALGVLLERVSGTLALDDEAFLETPMPQGPGDYLGPVAKTGGQLVQRIDVGGLLPADVRARLFADHEAAQ